LISFCAGALLIGFALSGRISFSTFLVEFSCVFRPPGRVSFMKAILAFTVRASLRLFASVPYGLVFGQRKDTKKKGYPAVLACGCFARLHIAGAAELAALRQSSLLPALSLQCSETQKGL
jgi:hypothetical protein